MAFCDVAYTHTRVAGAGVMRITKGPYKHRGRRRARAGHGAPPRLVVLVRGYRWGAPHAWRIGLGLGRRARSSDSPECICICAVRGGRARPPWPRFQHGRRRGSWQRDPGGARAAAGSWLALSAALSVIAGVCKPQPPTSDSASGCNHHIRIHEVSGAA